MRKAILVFIASACVSLAYAQDADFDAFKRIESDKVMNLSADQIAKIKQINREVGPKFKAIGQSNLPGYEKGQQKKALALEHKAAIRRILTENQIKIWESHYGSLDHDDGMRDIIGDGYDDRLDQLEEKFERDKEAIEESPLSKDTKKERIKVLKSQYKADKERLKAERDRAKKTGGLN